MNRLGFIVLFVLMQTMSFALDNLLQNIEVKNHELVLTFHKGYDKHKIKYFYLKHPSRHVFDLSGLTLTKYLRMQCHIKHVRIAQYNTHTVRIVIESESMIQPVSYTPMLSKHKYHITLPKEYVSSGKKTIFQKEIPQKKIPQKRTVNEIFDALEKENSSHVYLYPKKKIKASVQERRKFQKPKVHKNLHAHELIVIDAGHGGHDSGAIGGSKKEKHLVLSIARKVSYFLKKSGYSVYLTRTSDKFLKLSERTRIADRKSAVAFISIHANSVPSRKKSTVHGIETFFLQTTRDAKSQRIARRENAALLKYSGNSLSKSVIIDSVLNGPKIIESNKLAIDVQRRIITNVRSRYKGVKDGGVRHAPFYVLVGASRPSILVEVGYISHPKERKRLFTGMYQNLIAQGIAEGVNRYLNNRKKEIDFD